MLLVQSDQKNLEITFNQIHLIFYHSASYCPSLIDFPHPSQHCHARCQYKTANTVQPCIRHTDCQSCSSNSCYWTSAGTCTHDKSRRTACNDTCTRWDTCTGCHGDARCVWYKDTCTGVSNVVRGSNVRRNCPVVCGDIDDCTR